MKKLVALVVGLIVAASVTLSAADAPAKKALTDKQKEVMKAMIEKYDTNKDGKLSRDERTAMSQEDKDKMKEAGLGGGRKKAQ